MSKLFTSEELRQWVHNNPDLKDVISVGNGSIILKGEHEFAIYAGMSPNWITVKDKVGFNNEVE